jgi:hypothetical protein
MDQRRDEAGVSPSRDTCPIHHVKVELITPVPHVVDAGGAMTVTVRAECPDACNLHGAPVRLTGAGAVVAAGALERGAGSGCEATLRATAPAGIGEFTWSVELPRHDTAGAAHQAQSSVPICFRTRPHHTSMAVWDVPSPVPIDSPFRVKAGVRCAAGCQLTGGLVEVRGPEGTRVGQGQLGDTPWVGTSSLHWADVELHAPSSEGVVFWRAAFPADGLALPHEEASASFTFRADRPAEHRLTIRVVDQESNTALGGVEVRAGLYMTETDERGAVTLALPRGVYELTIRKDGFQAEPMTLNVAGDAMIQLEARRGPTKAELEEKMTKFEGHLW